MCDIIFAMFETKIFMKTVFIETQEIEHFQFNFDFINFALNIS